MKKIFLLASFVVAMSLNLFAQNDTVYYISFKESMGSWSIDDKVKPEAVSTIWQQTAQYGMKASAYVGGVKHVTESWFISAPLDLTSCTSLKMEFNQALNYATPDYVSVKITKDGANWETLTVPTMPEGNSWTFVQSGVMDITSYISDKTQIAFVYTSDAAAAATWEVDWILLSGDGERIVESEKPVEHISLADFVAKADPTTRYEVTATISEMKDNYYGNFWITDGTHNVYVYGLAHGDQNRNVVDSLAIEAGDEITLSGMYSWYTNAAGESYAELMNGRFVDVKHAPVVEDVNMLYYGKTENGGHEFFIECMRYKVVGEQNIDSILYKLDFISANLNKIEGKYTLKSDSLVANYTSIKTYAENEELYFNDGNVRLTATGNTKDTTINGTSYIAYEHIVDIYLKKYVIEGTDTTKTIYKQKILKLPLIAVSHTDDTVIEFNGTTTNIENVDKNIINDNKRYNLLGTIVDEQYKGVVILNGKKYIQ